jgi:hypothetical protein
VRLRFGRKHHHSHGMSFDMYVVLEADRMVTESAGRAEESFLRLIASSSNCPDHLSSPICQLDLRTDPPDSLRVPPDGTLDNTLHPALIFD